MIQALYSGPYLQISYQSPDDYRQLHLLFVLSSFNLITLDGSVHHGSRPSLLVSAVAVEIQCSDDCSEV